jgi:hypothetical protein
LTSPQTHSATVEPSETFITHRQQKASRHAGEGSNRVSRQRPFLSGLHCPAHAALHALQGVGPSPHNHDLLPCGLQMFSPLKKALKPEIWVERRRQGNDVPIVPAAVLGVLYGGDPLGDVSMGCQPQRAWWLPTLPRTISKRVSFEHVSYRSEGRQ